MDDLGVPLFYTQIWILVLRQDISNQFLLEQLGANFIFFPIVGYWLLKTWEEGKWQLD